MTRSTTDHELLVGLLALQNGLIQQAQLVAAFQAWTCEKSRSLGEHLVDMGYLTLTQRSAVEAIAGLHVEARGGDLERSLISVPTDPAVLSRLAMLADPELEATIGRIGIQSGQTDHDGDRTASPTHSSTSSDGQRFRVLRPHARGGLGAVFVAIDSELNREVALKQILDDHADDPTSRQRFVIEAKITGGLEHPGIVPVYGLGTDRDGRPYYAMRFVRGDSLKEAIGDFHGDSAHRSDPGRRSLELRKLLRRFTDVCNAIDYAHARGVLHRDIKPANIILGKHGETLVVDWGLAKSKGRPDPAAEERTLRPGPDREVPETLAGSAMGTPAYMSPEQALGELDRLTVRSDVFGLGATLYSLLAGVPPFVGDDAHSILRAAQECKPRPPRTLDPLVPCTLEAICLKALARDPSARYASAGALAEDVERWMADEPTSAREESTAERVSRWIRRRRTTVAALGAAMLVALMALGTILGFQSNINARLRVANQKVLRANTNLRDANKREGRRFDLALRAIQNYSDGLTDDQHLRQREFDALRGKLLGGALGFYTELEETLAKDQASESRERLALAYSNAGRLTSKIGSKEDALTAHRHALEIRRSLVAAGGDSPKALIQLGRSLADLGELECLTGQRDHGMSSLQEARDLLESACNRSPGYLELQHELARCDLRIGRASDGQGLHVEAIKAFGRAGATFKRILDRSPGNMEIRREFAQCSTDQGDQLTKAGKIDEAITLLVMARDAFRALADSQPGNEPARSDLGANLVRLGFTLNEGGRIGEARDAYEHARNVLEPLVASSPAISDYQERLAETNYRLATVLRSLSRYEDSLAAATRARELNQTLADRHPSVADYRANQSLNECQISAYHRQLRQNDAAIDRAREAVANAERSARIDPTAERCKFALAISNDTLGRPLFNAKRYAEALSALEKSRVHWKVYEQTYPDNSYTRAGLPSTLLNIALSHQRLGQPASAVQALREADQSFERIAVMNPATLYNHAGIHGNLAELAHVAGSGLTPDDGQIEEERAMTLVSRAVAAGYRNARIMQNDDALAVLRKRTDFQALLADLSFPADPFAH